MSHTKKDINDLYQKLRQYRGSLKEVATRSGKSYEWVRIVLLGKWHDTHVVRVATMVLKKRYDAERKVVSEVSQLINNCDIQEMRNVLNPAD